jgi:hypothetical protein
MTYRLLEYDYPSFRCDECQVIACSNRNPRQMWRKLAMEGWRRLGDQHLCWRCDAKLDEKPLALGTAPSTVEEPVE